MGKYATGSPFDRARTEAQRRWRIMPIGIVAAGAWRYAFVYDLVVRYFYTCPNRHACLPLSPHAERSSQAYHPYASTHLTELA